MLFFFLKCLPTRSAARLMIRVSIISIAAIAKATPNSPCSLAYTYKATVSVAPALPRPSNIPYSAWAKPAVNRSAADSPRYSSHRKYAAGYNAVNTAGKHYRTDYTPFACAKSECSLSVALRYCLKAFLSCTHYRRQIHYNQSQRSCHQRCLHIKKLAEKQHTYKAVYD